MDTRRLGATDDRPDFRSNSYRYTSVTDAKMQAEPAGVRYWHTPADRVETESEDAARKRGAAFPPSSSRLHDVLIGSRNGQRVS